MKRLLTIAGIALAGAAGLTSAVFLSGASALSADARSVFCSDFVPNEKASWVRPAVLWKWANDNPGEVSRWTTFADGICAGSSPSAPAMASLHGLTLLAAGNMALAEAEPPPTTTTEPPPTTTEPPPPTETEPPPPTETEPPPPTETEPPPPTETEPPANDCTDVLLPGGSLSSFVGSLRAGDVGCIRAGTYEAGCSLSWGQDGTSSNRIVLRNYPGEPATLRTNLSISGDHITVEGLTITDLRRCSSTSGVNISGTGVHVLGVTVDGASKHGMILHTSARNAIIARNFVRDVGPSGSTLEHGLYVQGTGHLIHSNVFTDLRGGYGIHVYGSSNGNTVIAQNTAVRSETRAGILVDTSGSGIIVVNNIAALNDTNGITYRQCGSGCVVDTNLVFGNGSSGIGGSLAGQATNTISADPLFADAHFRVAASSPAVDRARADRSYSPDRDGVARPQGAGPDLGAYER